MTAAAPAAVALRPPPPLLRCGRPRPRPLNAQIHRPRAAHWMIFTPGEAEKMQVFVAAEIARRRRGRGLKLNHPEAVALIADHILEGARDGRSVPELASSGRSVLARGDVLPGVPEMVRSVQVEATFEDGTKLVTVHDPIV